jgi:hypothetical protein
MYIAVLHSQPQGEAHGLESNRFVKLPSCPLAKTMRVIHAFSNIHIELENSRV